ncbi:MAG: hypothetical protein ACK5OB_16945 [Pirellula sp.]|jgi:hypothetical protein
MDDLSAKSKAASPSPLGNRPQVNPQQYLREMLSLDPSEWGARAMALRRSLLHPDSVPEAALPVRDQKTIERIVELMLRCQRQFWESDAEQCFAELDGQSLELAPELVPALKRLRQWFSARDSLRALHSKFGQNSLAHRLVQLAPMTSREQAASMAQILSERNGPLGRGFKRQAKIIKKDFPVVYALAPQWFDHLIQPVSSLF